MILPDQLETAAPADHSELADAALRCAAACWFLAMFIGQWLFVYYIVAIYGAPTVTGQFEGWTRRTTLIKGYVPGDTIGNLSFAAHVLFAAVIAFGGMLQLVPQIRARAIAVHRWNGRAFLTAAAVIGGGGLYMVWVRGARLDIVNSVSSSLNAVLILAFVAAAWRTARAHDVAGHRRWALRAFMVANGSGFFIRVGFAGWSVFTAGAGTNDTMSGPMNYALEFGAYLLPLAGLELYLRARAGASTRARLATAAILVALTAYMTAGTLAATASRLKLLG